MIESIRIESDEDGWHLILRDDENDEPHELQDLSGRTLDFRLSQDAAWGLVDAVKPVAEWRAEGEIQRANVVAGRDHEGRPLDEAAALGAPDEIIAQGIADEQADEAMRVAGDLERKRRRENP